MREAWAWTEHLKAHIPLALSGSDPEGIHQVRVAARRLRVYLDLLGWRVLQDDLRRLVRGVGRVRDLEVALGRGPWPQGFCTYLKGELQQARAHLPSLLASPWTEALLRGLATLPPLEGQGKRPALKMLGHLEQRAQDRLEALVQTPSLETLHAYRRALRRLRYAKEFLGLSAKREKNLQEALGEAQDLKVLAGLLREYLLRGGDEEVAEVQLTLEEEAMRRLTALLPLLLGKPHPRGTP